MRVLIIAEDPTSDYFLLEPIIQAMLNKIGRPSQVRICRDPVFRGVTAVLKEEALAQIIRRYTGMVDLFILCVDRDGDPSRRAVLDAREHYCSQQFQRQQNCTLLAEHAWQELEVWALAGCTDLPQEWAWREIRQERDPKEVYFEQYVRQRSLDTTPGGGRQTLGKQAASRYNRLRQLCPEDILELESRIRAWFEGM
jgi:hypothetical protein